MTASDRARDFCQWQQDEGRVGIVVYENEEGHVRMATPAHSPALIEELFGLVLAEYRKQMTPDGAVN